MLISTPADFGKTTLLSTWEHQNPITTAWLSLGRSDNDPARFLANIITALQSVDLKFWVDILEILQSPQPDYNEAILISIINQINTASIDNFVMILDDYHLITVSIVHTITNFLVDHLPPKMHLIIARF